MALEKATYFSEDLVKDLFNKAAGHSTLAKLGAQMPVSFVGNEVFTFSMDDEVEMVGEGGKKSAGASTVEPVKIVPFKVVYQTRVSDEFMYAAEEKKVEILKAFNEGFAKKVARGLDIMAIHGVNPRTKENAATITNCFAKLEGIKIKGLMAIPPICEENDEIIEYFTKMHKLFVDIKGKNIDNSSIEYLSMGMSQDYEQAIMCGANIVRVGSLLFGARNYGTI